MAHSIAFTALTAALILGIAAAQPTTNGTRFAGFSYAGNVIGYVNMTMDYCDIVAALMAGNFSAGLDVYANGKNSFSGAAKRTFFRFASHVPTAVEPTYIALTNGRNGSWLDMAIREAFAAGNAHLALGLIQTGTLKYMLHEVDEAANKIAAYVADPTLVSQLADATGAPHNIDEGWSLWVGGSPTTCGTLSSWADQLGDELQASFVGRASINNAMTLAFHELQAASRTGDLAAYNATRADVVRYTTILGLQGVMHALYKADLAVACKRPAADLAEQKSMITVSWSLLEAFLTARKMPAAYISALGKALTAPKPDYKKAQAAIKRVISGMGRRVSEIGTPDFKAINADWGCKAPRR
ncbi:hypothetical protein TSOC_011505 [Tetrabaena socialis]|uniref:Chitosanase n=1 Tax=Tetrabaena socialis TaxID=47790 RepID=A0A2J7ZQG7_9CHLO|nr:hypothetical protein TSOC_011505 [Tetrabaena socialis]|eukprot:PNH02515.1 hypothetical protein TSOC_011505 [Tetrabaena socialis]